MIDSYSPWSIQTSGWPVDTLCRTVPARTASLGWSCECRPREDRGGKTRKTRHVSLRSIAMTNDCWISIELSVRHTNGLVCIRDLWMQFGPWVHSRWENAIFSYLGCRVGSHVWQRLQFAPGGDVHDRPLAALLHARKHYPCKHRPSGDVEVDHIPQLVLRHLVQVVRIFQIRSNVVHYRWLQEGQSRATLDHWHCGGCEAGGSDENSLRWNRRRET